MSRLVLTSIALCAMTVMIPATTLCADAVLDWNGYAAKAIVTVGGQVPPRALIRLAMVHLAIYDAVNAIEGAQFESYASSPAVHRPASARASIARGQAIFNSKPITIFGVAGINDVTGLPVSFIGTCGTCHDSPNVGHHSVSVPLNIGVADVNSPLDVRYLPVFTRSIMPPAKRSRQPILVALLLQGSGRTSER